MGTGNVQESIKLSQEKRQEDKLGNYGESKGGKCQERKERVQKVKENGQESIKFLQGNKIGRQDRR